MNKQHIEDFGKIPQPPQESWTFLADLKSPIQYHFRSPANIAELDGCMKNGAALILNGTEVPETAQESLRRVFQAKSIREKDDGYPIRFLKDATLEKEEYRVDATADETRVFAGDPEGFRRAVYFLEDRICETPGPDITKGCWQRKPFVKNRISRCFFGPTNRPPFRIDELMNDIDYYPEEYLNKLAHEGINGLWLTMYFRDLPSSIFPSRGAGFEKRIKKLRQTVKKCARYGIRIFIFLSEPKKFGRTPPFQPMEEAEPHPELFGAAYHHHGLDLRMFCTSDETGISYLKESISLIFSAVPELGGVINIMLGEDSGSCAAFETTEAEPIPPEDHCPRCSRRDHAEIFRDQALAFSRTIHQYNPDAEYIGWFYAPRQHDGSAFMKRLAHIAEKWPDDASIMFNFESGGTSMQLGKKRVVLDYSLAYVGPSDLFAQVADTAPRTAAKLQVGCSHEDASIPFIPVPANLYEKYRFLHDHRVSSVMQCWYFGNYPGLMNKAAGELSFEPFPENASDFLMNLARPDWQENAETAARAWAFFSEAYRKFPSNINFEWYGPLHQSIVWPLHLFPVDQPISPSWLLKEYPEVSGDRIGECFGYFHTLEEGLQLCREMSQLWQKGMAILESLRDYYRNDPERLKDINLSAAVGLQMKSTCNVLQFYALREDMFFRKNDHLAEMRSIVLDEITNTLKMEELCRQDGRLGYHPEAEGFLFFPEKLLARAALLRELLTDDFSCFSLDEKRIKAYTGESGTGISAELPRRGTHSEKTVVQGWNITWSGEYDDRFLYLTIHNARHRNFTLAIEPCRLWPLFIVDFYRNDNFHASDLMFVDPPEIGVSYEGKDVFAQIPFQLFNGFRRKGFPMRINLWSLDGDFYWTKPQLLPKGRLQFGQIKPDGLGWIYFS